MTFTQELLEALEQKAERALEKAEQGWREFAETMRDIKENEAHKGAGYRYFQPYYREVWAARAGRSWDAIDNLFQRLTALEEFEAAVSPSISTDLKMPNATAARDLRGQLSDPENRVAAWLHHLDSGRGLGRHREGLHESIAEYKGTGVLEHMEEREVEIPEYPAGPTPEERAYTAASELLSAAMDVTPEAAADSISPGLADTVAKRYEALIPWTQRFVAQLHLRSAGGAR